jgi:hypothetical protein
MITVVHTTGTNLTGVGRCTTAHQRSPLPRIGQVKTAVKGIFYLIKKLSDKSDGAFLISCTPLETARRSCRVGRWRRPGCSLYSADWVVGRLQE